MAGSMAENVNPPTELTNRRSASRRRTLLPGLIVYANGAQTCDCLLRDLTATGARIVLTQFLQLPDHFQLINIRDGIAYCARLVWVKGGEMGVKFETVISLSSNTELATERLKKLWLAKAPR